MSRLLPPLHTVAVCTHGGRCLGQFFSEELTVDAVRVALERERMVARVGKKDGRDARVEVDDLPLREPDLWIKDLCQVRQLQGAAIDLNLDRRFLSHLRAP